MVTVSQDYCNINHNVVMSLEFILVTYTSKVIDLLSANSCSYENVMWLLFMETLLNIADFVTPRNVISLN